MHANGKVAPSVHTGPVHTRLTPDEELHGLDGVLLPSGRQQGWPQCHVPGVHVDDDPAALAEHGAQGGKQLGG